MPDFNLHTLGATSALVIAFAMTSCAPTAKTTDASAPLTHDASPVSTPPQGSESMQTPPPMGKRAAPPPGQVLGPFIGFKGGGEGWRIELFNTSGLDNRTTLTWDNGAKRGEGMLTYQPAADGSLERKALEGRLNVEGDGKDTSVQLIEDDCTGGDGITHDHTVVVTVSGMAPMRGCGDIAL
jgi:hypothetical protein